MSFLKGLVALRRMAKFLGLPDIKADNVDHIDNQGSLFIFSSGEVFFVLQLYLMQKNIVKIVMLIGLESMSNPVIIENGNFAWNSDGKIILHEYVMTKFCSKRCDQFYKNLTILLIS